MGGKQTKVKACDFYHDASEDRKQVLRDIVVTRAKELEGEDKIDLQDLNEYIFRNHGKDYLRMTKKEIVDIVSNVVSRPHIVLPNHIWFIRQKS